MAMARVTAHVATGAFARLASAKRGNPTQPRKSRRV